MLLLFCICVAVPPSLLQTPLPLSLPVDISAIPPPWQFLTLSQLELGPLFSNSSPFASSQSLYMVPPPGWAPRPGFQASFGPYSVTQLIPEPVLQLSPHVSACLLSEFVERQKDEGGRDLFRVRVLFHKQVDTISKETCITLHAFKDTQEHRVSCVTQPPLNLCVVELKLPSSWFEDQSGQHQDLTNWHHKVRPLRQQKREQQQAGRHFGKYVKRRRAAALSLRSHPAVKWDMQEDNLKTLTYQPGPARNQIQLYYSSFDTMADIELTPPGCAEDRLDKSQRQLFHIRAVTLREEEEGGKEKQEKWKNNKEETCSNRQEEEEEELSLDSHVLIRYHKGPVLIGQTIKVSVNLRSDLTAELAVVRLRVKKGLVSMVAKRTVTSDLWTVTLERSQDNKHDIMSFFCHKHSMLKHTLNPALLQQVVCLSLDGQRQSFGVAMTVSADWWVEYPGQTQPVHGTTTLTFSDRHIVGIAPITESNTIINTAILTNQPVSLPVIVLAVSSDGKVSDVTSAVTCYSPNQDTVKVSSDCSSLFVDGSESGLGDTGATVEFQLGTLRGSVSVAVWVPSLPLRVTLADPVLNAISGWNNFTESGCVPVYQRTSVQVLTQFMAQDSHNRNTHLLGSSDWFVEVTELVRNRLSVENPTVASLGNENTLIGLQPGRTTIQVLSKQWAGVLGRCDVTVTSDPVTAGDLSVQVVSGLGMLNTASPAHPSVVTATVTAYNTLFYQHQEAVTSIWLQFSDDTASLLSSFSDLPYSLRLSSLAESVVMVTPGPNQRIFAQGDGGGPLLRAELLVSTCTERAVDSNSISEEDWDWTDSGETGSTNRLAGGSGWIRVNLDLGFLRPREDKVDEGEDELLFEISDTLVKSDNDMYGSNYGDRESGNETSDSWKMEGRNRNQMENRGTFSRNDLERAMLMPRQDEGTLFFSRSNDKIETGRKEDELGKEELEVGVGAIVSLFCLSAVLFLANCLPCALRDRRRTKMNVDQGEGEMEGGAKEEVEKEKEEEERTTAEGEDEMDLDKKKLY